MENTNPMTENDAPANDTPAVDPLDLKSKSSAVYQHFIDKYGINTDYKEAAYNSLNDWATLNDGESSEYGQSQAARQANKIMWVYDLSRENQLEFLEKVGRENARSEVNHPSEVVQLKTTRNAAFLNQCKENLAKAQSAYIGALESYNTHFSSSEHDRYVSIEQRRQIQKANTRMNNQAADAEVDELTNI